MNKDKVHWALYWFGVGFIVWCLVQAMGACSTANAGHRGTCLGVAPDCDYGRVPICWCLTGSEECSWYCVSDGRAARQERK